MSPERSTNPSGARRRPPRFAGALPAEVDVAVIGGGICGLTAAYLLKKTERRVAVFERERLGAGDTGNTSAHLTYVTDDVKVSAVCTHMGLVRWNDRVE